MWMNVKEFGDCCRCFLQPRHIRVAFQYLQWGVQAAEYPVTFWVNLDSMNICPRDLVNRVWSN